MQEKGSSISIDFASLALRGLYLLTTRVKSPLENFKVGLEYKFFSKLSGLLHTPAMLASRLLGDTTRKLINSSLSK